MNRRQFLRLSGTGVVASATMAEAGILAEFLSWLQRKPTWFIPKRIKVTQAVYGQPIPIIMGGRKLDPSMELDMEKAIEEMWANFQPAPNTIWVTRRRYKEVMRLFKESA